jgi:hypothetical protein
MSTTDGTPLSHRDRAILRAVAAGRCQLAPRAGFTLTIDGLACCDQLAGRRLAQAGLIDASGLQPGPARLTATGQALLEAA